MDPYPQQIEIEIDKPKLVQYIRVWAIFLCILVSVILYLSSGILYFAVGIISSLIVLVTVGDWLIRKRVEGYKYQVDGNYIRIKIGVFFKKDILIPLDEVKSFLRYQGPLMKYLNIGGIVIEKGSFTVAASAEDQAILALFQPRLMGLTEPEKVLDTLGKIKAIRTMNA